MQPITELARERLGIADEFLEPYGRYKAKISLGYDRQHKDNLDRKLVHVTNLYQHSKQMPMIQYVSVVATARVVDLRCASKFR